VSHQERPPDTHWLTQLAHIATGPQSPLLRRGPLSVGAGLSSTSSNLHSYARPPPPRGHGRERRSTRVENSHWTRLFINSRHRHTVSGEEIQQQQQQQTASFIRFHSVFPQKSSECGSAVSTRSSLSNEEDMGWSFSCPPTAWHCFLKGTHTHTHLTFSFSPLLEKT